MISEYRISRTIVPAPSLALVTLDEARAALQIAPEDFSQDASLAAQINSVSSAIHRYCDHILVQQSYRDQFRYIRNHNWPGDGLQLRQYPIALDPDGHALVAVSEDGAPIDDAVIEADTERGLVFRLDGGGPYAWTGLLVAVDYTAGYDPVPDDVKAAALDWLTSRYYSQGRDPALRSETIPDVLSQVYAGDMGAGTAGGAIPSAARDLLVPYRLWSL